MVDPFSLKFDPFGSWSHLDFKKKKGVGGKMTQVHQDLVKLAKSLRDQSRIKTKKSESMTITVKATRGTSLEGGIISRMTSECSMDPGFKGYYRGLSAKVIFIFGDLGDTPDSKRWFDGDHQSIINHIVAAYGCRTTVIKFSRVGELCAYIHAKCVTEFKKFGEPETCGALEIFHPASGSVRPGSAGVLPGSTTYVIGLDFMMTFTTDFCKLFFSV